MRVSQKEAELRDLVITGLTHLVTANSETGFKQCLPLAYDDDHRKRAIFAHVFARVIGEGTTFEPQEKAPPPNKHARFSEVGHVIIGFSALLIVLPAAARVRRKSPGSN